MITWQERIAEFDEHVSNLLIDLSQSRQTIATLTELQLTRMALGWHQADTQLQDIQQGTDEWSVFDQVTRLRDSINELMEFIDLEIAGASE